MNYMDSPKQHFNPRSLVIFTGWWVKTLFWAASVPFVLLGFLFWIGRFSGVTMADVHGSLVAIASSATHQEWEAGGGSSILNFMLALPAAAVIAWRILRSKTASSFSKFIETRSQGFMLRIIARINPKWASEENTYTNLLLLPVLCFIAFLAFILFTSSARPTHNTINGGLPLKPEGIKAPVASAAISLPDGQVISGVANVTKEGERWVIEFNESSQPK